MNLLGGQITDASAEILSQFTELRDLNLYRSRITNAGLSKLQSLKKLEMLDLRYSGVNNAGVQAFRAAVPECKITYVDSAPRVPISKNLAPAGSERAGYRTVASNARRTSPHGQWKDSVDFPGKSAL